MKIQWAVFCACAITCKRGHVTRSLAMRKEFLFPKLLSTANWFPGHMARGLRVMNRRLQDCDCVLEIHDARIPFSGRNPKFRGMVSRRPKILVLNKMDMADSSTLEVMHNIVCSDVRVLYYVCCICRACKCQVSCYNDVYNRMWPSVFVREEREKLSTLTASSSTITPFQRCL
jgi:hypothetical protein